MPGYIEFLDVQTLVLNPRNARTYSKKQIKQIAESIREFGFTAPLLIDEQNEILAGHGRLAAAQLLQMKQVPCIRIANLTALQKRAYIIADNKLALNAGWDEDLLARELKELVTIDESFNVDVTGFTIAEIDGVIEGLNVEEPGDPRDDALPALKTGRAVTQPGDIWSLGNHRLICGDARDPEVVKALMAGEVAEVSFCDPPYNVPIVGHVSGLGKNQHREFAMASGEMTKSEFTDFLRKSFKNLADHSCDGSIHFICMDWRHMAQVLAAGESTFAELKNLIAWIKDNAGMGTFYRSRHELIFAYKKGTAPHINTFELGQHGRHRSNCWFYRGANSFGAGREVELALHPTVKPVTMIADALHDVSRRNGIVLDLFGGSGSTLVAAHKTGRRGYLCELDPKYCDVIINRYQTYAKDDATLTSTNETFAQRQAHGQPTANGSPLAPQDAKPKRDEIAKQADNEEVLHNSAASVTTEPAK